MYAHNEILFTCKGKEILTHGPRWINPEDMLSKISKKKKDQNLFYELPRTVRFIEAKSRMAVARECRVGQAGVGSWCLMGLNWESENSPADGYWSWLYNHVNIRNITELYNSKWLL